MTGASAAPARVLVLVRPGCHLCEDAVAVVERVCRERGQRWLTRDITGDPELEPRYTDQIPVIFVDGAQHDFYRVDPARLSRALDG